MGLNNQELLRIKAYSKSVAEKSVKKTIRESHNYDSSEENKTLLYQCYNDWYNMSSVRAEHKRNQRYKNGNQWDDVMEDPDNPGQTITEKAYISRSGRSPLINNMIQQTVRSIHGQAMSNPTKPTVIARCADDSTLSEMLTNTLQKGLQLNKYNIIKTSELESLLSAGICIAKVRYTYWNLKNNTDVKVDFINVNRFFFNQDTEDPTLDDLCRCGEIHDYSYNDLIRDFYVQKGDEEALREIYNNARKERDILLQDKASRVINSLDFYGISNNNKYRVYEIWQKRTRKVEYVHDQAKGEEIYDEQHGYDYYEQENASRRIQMQEVGIDDDIIEQRLIIHRTIVEEYWEARWLTPNGICIKRIESPYEHQSHPYVIGQMPRIDGIAKPILSHLCEIQRTANRHLTMIDYSLASAAKGLLLVPSSALKASGMSLEEYGINYTKPGGCLVFDDSNPNNQMPKQISSNPIPVGAFDFLRTELEALKDVSGLSGALQGQVSRSNTPASLYAQQAQNSMVNFVLLFDCFKDFNQAVSEKTLQVQMQYYTTKRHVDISGQTYNKTAIYYEPQMKNKIVEWNVVVADSNDTPVFRQVADDFLKYLYESQAINVEMLLENSSYPYAQKLLAQLRSANTQAQNGDMSGAQQTLSDMGNLPPTTPQAQAALQSVYNSNDDPMVG